MAPDAPGTGIPQHTLNDGVADLNADIDHDLRDRMREITRLAEEELDAGGDPGRTWDRFATWVQQQVASAASANFVWATERARWLSRRRSTTMVCDVAAGLSRTARCWRSRSAASGTIGARSGTAPSSRPTTSESCTRARGTRDPSHSTASAASSNTT